MANLFSSPMLSNWQSAIAKVATSPGSLAAESAFLRALQRPPLDFDHPLVAAGAFASQSFEQGIAGAASAPPQSDIERCAKAALNLAIAKVQRDHEAIEATQAILARYGECDLRWAECIVEFLAHYAVTRHGIVPYRRWRSLDDFVLPSALLPDRCRIGIIGDWGTGEARAQAVLEQVATHDVQILIHIGDIYYSCTTAEANAFYENVRAVFDRLSDVQIFSLSGNHDMYSGGAPYYALLDRLGQPASFFCLRNAAWQVIAGDTGYNDFDPFDHGGVASWIQHFDDRDSPYSELLWHRDKFQTAAGRRSILLTHHQPFSRNAAVDGKDAVNQRLMDQLRSNLGQIDLWLWGHEHNQVVYAPFAGLRRGRCVGASAIPEPARTDLYRRDPAIVGECPDLDADAKPLSVDPELGLYNLGFAILELDGRHCRETYYEFDTTRRIERELYAATI